MSILSNCFGGSASGYVIDNSLRLRAAASAYLNRTFGAPTDNLKWTWRGVVKRGRIGSAGNDFLIAATSDAFASWMNFGFENASSTSTDYLTFDQYSGGYQVRCKTDAIFRDPSGWYDIFLVYDSANATSTDRVQIFVNGTRQTVTYAFGPFGGSTPSKWNVNGADSHLGRFAEAYFDGYLSDVYFIDGQALTPSSFGETNSDGVWVPKAYSGTYGTNGFHLDFKDAALTAGSNAGLGKDVSGNANYWTTNNISVTAGVTYDSMVDTPTNNYATLNPLTGGFPFSPVITNGNLEANPATSGGANAETVSATMQITTRKYYFEVHPTAIPNTSLNLLGVSTTGLPSDSSYVFYGSDGQKYVGGIPSAYGATFTTTDVIGVACDGDGGTITFYKNNVSQGSIAVTYPVWPAVRTITSTVTSSQHKINFGQRPFTYTPPTGFKALCTANLPAVAIPNPKKHFDAKTRVGTAATYSVTGLGFGPGLVWPKSRGRAVDHALYDYVRGVEKRLESNNTDAEVTGDTTGLTAFNSDGYTGGALDQINGTTATNSFIDWLWKAGGAPTVDNSAGANNTPTAGSVKIDGANLGSALAGSIAATRLSANTTAGFSIVTYTGTGVAATVGHGLGVAPKLVIVKSQSLAGYNWNVTGPGCAANENLALQATYASGAMGNGVIGAITLTTFEVKTDFGSCLNVNGNTYTYVAYCFAEIAGYSKFGSYIGNSSTDGPFVYCGFRPRYVMVKGVSGTTGSWYIADSARDTYNVIGGIVIADTSGAESPGNAWIDFTANGFKLKYAGGSVNATGGTYIFAAFAEHPFGGANVSPAPAR